MDGNLVLQVAVILATGGAMYGAIRSDLKGMVERIARAEKNIEDSTKRFDQHIEFHLQERR